MKMHKVRFNLSRGVNYMKWKITYPDGRVEYHTPDAIQITMQNCQLRNNRKTAEKIYAGENKSVCAWILCESLAISNPKQLENHTNLLRYNPKVKPYWYIQGDDSSADNHYFNTLSTYGKQIHHVFSQS